MTVVRKGNVGANNKEWGFIKKATTNPVEKAVCLVLSTPNNELEKITKNHFSKVSGIDYEELERDFKTARGLTSFELIKREKLYRAAFVLEQNREITIPDLSHLLGFVDVVDFETGFNDYFLISPARYRELKQKAHINHGR